MEEEFFITLPSDQHTSPNAFENTISNYTTYLPESRELRGDWKVGLSQIIFPVTWNNFPKDERIDFYPVSEGSIIEHGIEEIKIIIKAGAYDAKSLIKTINDEIVILFKDSFSTWNLGTVNPVPKLKLRTNNTVTMIRGVGYLDGWLKFIKYDLELDGKEETWDEDKKEKYNSRVKRYKDEFPAEKMHWSMRMSTQLLIALGLWGKDPDELCAYLGNHETFTGSQPVDLDSIYRNVFVYSDLIQHTTVGNTFAPLLRVVSVNGNRDKVIQENNYEWPFFHKLAHNFINSINISIRDITGDYFHFKSGRVVVTLRFVKVKN